MRCAFSAFSSAFSHFEDYRKEEDRLVTSDLALDVLKLKGTSGGEVRVELVVNAQARLSGDVLVKARAVLYEGTSEIQRLVIARQLLAA